jgi:four helix bundle protein
MSTVSNYRDLLVWQRSMDLVERIYRITEKIPDRERWGLVSQMCRAAVSVPANIAEGYGRQSTGEYRHFLSIARGSLSELETHLLLSQRLGYLDAAEVPSVLNEVEEILKMLAGLISKIQ